MIKQISPTYLELATRLRSACVSATQRTLWRHILLALLSGVGGASLASAQVSITAGINPRAVAINPVTNKIYVANVNSANVTVIDGANNTTATVPVGTTPFAVAVNPVTNKIYVANSGSSNITVIDGANNSVTNVAAGINPFAVAVNPMTNKI